MSLPPENLSTVKDFLENDAFRTWMLERRPEDRVYWQQWLTQYPDKEEIYEQAVATFLVIQGQTVELSDQQVKEKTEEILDRLPNTFVVSKPLFSWQWTRWVAAAMVVSMLVWWWPLSSTTFTQISAISKPEKQPIRNDEWKIAKNITGQPLVVLLPDNSSVLLSTNSQLRFRKKANHPLREVYLQGEAFFEVSKDPTKPFLVYTTNLTTKVLGTSFQVRSYDRESTAFVRVKTGRVTVTPVASPDKAVLLAPNEKLSLGGRNKQPVKRETLEPAENTTAIIDQPFDFEYTPVNEIFTTLEGQYHMPIRYDHKLLKDCSFTGKLNDVPFLEKIRLICLTIESTYVIVDNQVVIHSRGCN